MEKTTNLFTTKRLIVIFLIIISSVIIGFVYYINKNKLPDNGVGISGYILGTGVDPTLTQEEIEALLQKQVDESKIAFSIYTEPVFEGKRGIIVFANPRYNAHDIDLTVTVDGSEIIKTQRIAPNQYIEEIELLTEALPKGKHKGVATIKGYNVKTGQEVGEVLVDMEITSK